MLLKLENVVACAAACATLIVAPGTASAQSSSHPTKPASKGKHAHAPAPAAHSVARPVVKHVDTAAVTSSALGVVVPATTAGALAASGPVTLSDAPDGRGLATIAAGTPLTPLARDRGWVRVQVDGWVKDDGLAPSTATVGALSAADLRADPQKARGTVVRWNVQVLALAHADVLHKDLTPDEPYLLARGPGAENAMLYIAIPPALLQAATTLTAVAPVTATIVATVRNGKSAPLGVPILDAQSLARR